MAAKVAAKEIVRRRGEKLFCYGRWKRTIDSRRRIALPPRFRQGFGREIVIVEEGEGFSVFPITRLRHNFDDLSKVWIATIDNQGRIGIPSVISYSKPKVVWLGRGDHLEVLLF